MYITTVKNRNSNPTILLRESYRENGKVKNRTLANLTKWDNMRIEAMSMALKGEFDGITHVIPEVGESFGTLFILKQIADKLGIVNAFGKSREGLLSLFLVLARVSHKGSRLSAIRWSKTQAVKEILGLKSFNEDHLYKALDWLESHQEQIEKKLFDNYLKTHQNKIPALLLYDVTSSYFEGTKNELAEFGYNRDKKSGKKQIVIGLLTTTDGEPIAVRVFKGNTSDPSTIYEQIELVKKNFGIEEIIFVGDKGMIKTKGKEAIQEQGWNYITSLTKAEIGTLVKKEIVQYSFFDQDLYEIVQDGKRYILKRNEATSYRLKNERQKKVQKLIAKVEERNEYVLNHPRAKVESGLKNLGKLMQNWRIDKFTKLSIDGKEIKIEIDEKAQISEFILDGCMVIETDVTSKIMDKKDVVNAYKNLHLVEANFRNMKTSLLEVRPIFLRKGNRTKGHVFVSMLALKISLYFQNILTEACGTTDEDRYNLTMEDAFEQLNKLCFLQYEYNGKKIQRLASPSQKQQWIFALFNCNFPDSI